MKKILVKFVIGVFFLLGILALAYPAAANYVNQVNDTKVIQELERQWQNADNETLETQRNLARWYNLNLTASQPEEDFSDAYNSILDYSDHTMGYIVIPAIGERLPIYHGTGDAVLSEGIGHLPVSAFPLGGEGNHAVLIGYAGLPGAELFSDLKDIEAEDLFYIHILNETLVYRVAEIKSISSEGTDSLLPAPGEDLCTLVACTPYGDSSQPLLVRGVRVELVEQGTEVTLQEQSEMGWMGIVLIGILLTSMSILLVGVRRKGTFIK